MFEIFWDNAEIGKKEMWMKHVILVDAIVWCKKMILGEE